MCSSIQWGWTTERPSCPRPPVCGKGFTISCKESFLCALFCKTHTTLHAAKNIVKHAL